MPVAITQGDRTDVSVLIDTSYRGPYPRGIEKWMLDVKNIKTSTSVSMLADYTEASALLLLDSRTYLLP